MFKILQRLDTLKLEKILDAISSEIPLHKNSRILTLNSDQDDLLKFIKSERDPVIVKFTSFEKSGNYYFPVYFSLSSPPFKQKSFSLILAGRFSEHTESTESTAYLKYILELLEDDGLIILMAKPSLLPKYSKEIASYGLLKPKSVKFRNNVGIFAQKSCNKKTLAGDKLLNTENPAISIVIPAYNEEKNLPRLLDSLNKAAAFLREHEGANSEIIVVDNASLDKTSSVAASLGARVVFEPVKQIARARNCGARAAAGSIIAFCDGDNIVSENLLLEIYKGMKTDEYVGGGVLVHMEKGPLFARFVQFVFNTISYFMGVSGGVIYTYRETFIKLGGFNELYYAGEDGLFLKELTREAKRQFKKFLNVRKG